LRLKFKEARTKKMTLEQGAHREAMADYDTAAVAYGKALERHQLACEEVCRTQCALQDTQRNLNSAHLAVMAAVTRLADSRNTQQEAK
jgi:hypothetical protein